MKLTKLFYLEVFFFRCFCRFSTNHAGCMEINRTTLSIFRIVFSSKPNPTEHCMYEMEFQMNLVNTKDNKHNQFASIIDHFIELCSELIAKKIRLISQIEYLSFDMFDLICMNTLYRIVCILLIINAKCIEIQESHCPAQHRQEQECNKYCALYSFANGFMFSIASEVTNKVRKVFFLRLQSYRCVMMLLNEAAFCTHV